MSVFFFCGNFKIYGVYPLRTSTLFVAKNINYGVFTQTKRRGLSQCGLWGEGRQHGSGQGVTFYNFVRLQLIDSQTYTSASNFTICR